MTNPTNSSSSSSASYSHDGLPVSRANFSSEVSRVIEMAELTYPQESIESIFANRTAEAIYEAMETKNIGKLTFCLKHVTVARQKVLSFQPELKPSPSSDPFHGYHWAFLAAIPRSLFQKPGKAPLHSLPQQTVLQFLQPEKKEEKGK